MSKEAQQENVIPSEYLLSPEEQAKLPDAPMASAAPAPEAPDPEADIPEQFRGKSPVELVKIIRDSQTELGRKNNEIGTIRKLADELLGIRTGAASKPVDEKLPQRKPLTTDALFQDPEQAVVEVVRGEAQSREAASADRLARLEYDLNLQKFENRHPNFKETVEDPNFASWVQKSALRTNMALAAQQGNFMAADELLNLYNEMKEPAPARETAPDPTAQARAAGLVRSGSSAAGSAPAQSRQIWSRSKLLDMRINNPDEFERLQPEILKAYAEKRVR